MPETYVKRIGDELLEKYPDNITTDFSHNKEIVTQCTDILNDTYHSIKIRNKIAGYITRKKKQEADGIESTIPDGERGLRKRKSGSPRRRRRKSMSFKKNF